MLLPLMDKYGPAINWALTGSLPGRMTFTRTQASPQTTTAIGSDGLLKYFNANEPRFDYDLVTGRPLGLLYEPQRTNMIRNSTMQGGVSGVMWAGAALPTNWQIYTLATGLTFEVAFGVERGLPYIDLHVYGVPTAAAMQLFFESTTGAPAVKNDQCTASCRARLVAGSLNNVSSVSLGIQETSSPGSYVTEGSTVIGPIGSAFLSGPYKMTRALTGATTAYARPFIMPIMVVGQAVDFTLRIYAPQFEKGSTPTSYIPTSSINVTRASDQLAFTIPVGVTFLRYTFDDNSTQDVTVSAGPYTVPTNLNRPNIKRIVSV